MSAKVFRSGSEAQGTFGPCALAIGNFDGVHAGHLLLLRETVAAARRHGVVPAVLTFDPHPTAVVAPSRIPLMISSLAERLRLIGEAGIEQIMVLPFTPEIAAMDPEQFARIILADLLQTRCVLVGDNFLFGRRQAGNCDVLKDLGGSLGFQTCFVPPVSVRGQVVSSSAIRRALQAGNVTWAGRLLQRCFDVRSAVVSGQGIGSKQTVPTLNQAPEAGRVYPPGVFVTETIDDASGRRWPSITNVGVRPTFSGEGLSIETFLLASLDEPVPSEIAVRFFHFVRSERSFPDPAALRTQIMTDVGRAQRFWHLYERWHRALNLYTEGSV